MTTSCFLPGVSFGKWSRFSSLGFSVYHSELESPVDIGVYGALSLYKYVPSLLSYIYIIPTAIVDGEVVQSGTVQQGVVFVCSTFDQDSIQNSVFQYGTFVSTTGLNETDSVPLPRFTFDASVVPASALTESESVIFCPVTVGVQVSCLPVTDVDSILLPIVDYLLLIVVNPILVEQETVSIPAPVFSTQIPLFSVVDVESVNQTTVNYETRIVSIPISELDFVLPGVVRYNTEIHHSTVSDVDRVPFPVLDSIYIILPYPILQEIDALNAASFMIGSNIITSTLLEQESVQVPATTVSVQFVVSSFSDLDATQFITTQYGTIIQSNVVGEEESIAAPGVFYDTYLVSGTLLEEDQISNPIFSFYTSFYTQYIIEGAVTSSLDIWRY